MRMLDVNKKIRKTPKEDTPFDSSLPLVLTHLDLHPQNLILSPDGRLWVVDWEYAGFCPQWFEYYEMMLGTPWNILGSRRWKRWIIGFIAGFYEKQAKFLYGIAWALGTQCGIMMCEVDGNN